MHELKACACPPPKKKGLKNRVVSAFKIFCWHFHSSKMLLCSALKKKQTSKHHTIPSHLMKCNCNSKHISSLISSGFTSRWMGWFQIIWFRQSRIIRKELIELGIIKNYTSSIVQWFKDTKEAIIVITKAWLQSSILTVALCNGNSILLAKCLRS